MWEQHATHIGYLFIGRGENHKALQTRVNLPWCLTYMVYITAAQQQQKNNNKMFFHALQRVPFQGAIPVNTATSESRSVQRSMEINK